MTLVTHAVHHSDLTNALHYVVPPGSPRPVQGSLITIGQPPRLMHVVMVTDETALTRTQYDVGIDWPEYVEIIGQEEPRTCASCKRLVSPLHTNGPHPFCRGDPTQTCYAHGCGLPFVDSCYDNRSFRRYCAVHYEDFCLRRERDGREDPRLGLLSRTTFALLSHATIHSSMPAPDSLLNDQFRPPPSSDRVLMNVHPEVRENLRALLREPEMMGVGYSAFISRCIEVAWRQIAEARGEPFEETGDEQPPPDL